MNKDCHFPDTFFNSKSSERNSMTQKEKNKAEYEAKKPQKDKNKDKNTKK